MSKTRTLPQKVGRSRRISRRVKNTYPQAKSASKTCTLKQKVGHGVIALGPAPRPDNQPRGDGRASKTRTLRQKVRQKHVPLSKKSAPVELRDGIEPPSKALPSDPAKRCFLQNTRVFSCILRHVGSAPQAERGRGEVNLSPHTGSNTPAEGRRIFRVWKAVGGSMCRILRVWKLKTSINTSHLLGFGRPRAGVNMGDPW